MCVCVERAGDQRTGVPHPPRPPSSPECWARTSLVQGRLLHQLERGLVNTAAVKTDRLAQLLLLPGLNLSGRGGQSPNIPGVPFNLRQEALTPKQPS